MKDLDERRKLIGEYYREWKESDCPKREEYKTKKEYRKAKNKWNQENSSIDDYLIKRFSYYTFGSKDLELAKMYKELLEAIKQEMVVTPETAPLFA